MLIGNARTLTQVQGLGLQQEVLPDALDMLRKGDTLVTRKSEHVACSRMQGVDLVGVLHLEGDPPSDVAMNLGVSEPALYGWGPAFSVYG